MTLRTQHQNIGLDTHALQFLDRVLCGLGLQLIGSLQIGHVGQVHTNGVPAQLPTQLSDGLHKRCTLNITNGAAHLGNHEVKLFALFVLSQHSALNLIRDMRHHLNGLAQIITTALAVYHRLIDTSGGNRVVTCGVNTREALIVAQIQVGLHTVGRHIALAMLIGIQRTWVDVNVGVKLLDGYFIAACLQQFSNGGGDDAFSQRGNDTACNKDIFCVHKTNVFYGLQKKRNVFSSRLISVFQKYASIYYKLSKTSKSVG